MGLIHFPTPIPFSGKSQKKFRGRKVRSIERIHAKQDSSQTKTQLSEAARDAVSILKSNVPIVEYWLKLTEEYLSAYLATEAHEWGVNVNGAHRPNPSIREIQALRGAAVRFAQYLAPVAAALGESGSADKMFKSYKASMRARSEDQQA